MNYANIKYNDIANGPGIRTSLFVSGCRNNCPGCFNKDAQNFNYGNEFTDDIQNEIIKSIESPHYSGITILGGEPMEPENAKELVKFVNKFKSIYKNKTIWLFSGYKYEFLRDTGDDRSKLLSLVDVIVDGPFIEELKDVSLCFRGSSNQRIIEVSSGTDISKIFDKRGYI